MTTSNRIVMPGMGTFFKYREGQRLYEIHRDYYEARASGGTGLVIVEIVAVDPGGIGYHEQLRIDHDGCIAPLAEIAAAIKRHGARAACQLQHSGSAADPAVLGHQPLGPSPVNLPGCALPRQLTKQEIGEIVQRFAIAAERARKAGFDGVEIHACHQYLLAQFMSPAWNRRDDEYGGSARNRARMLLEVIVAVRERVGADYPVWCRINGTEFRTDHGISIEDACEMASWAEEAGVDALNVSGSPPLSAPYYQDELNSTLPKYAAGVFVRYAAAVKRRVGVPVMVAGMLGPETGERVLAEGHADFIALGRPLIADPELANKLASARADEIAPCVRCNCCLEPIPDPFTRNCTVNAAKGREREYAIVPAQRAKRVVVVGGGPAGMEAARVAALRGHGVTLYERCGRLGGQLIFAALLKYEYNALIAYFERQMQVCGVRVLLGRECRPEDLERERPDAVIVASGARLSVPDIAGSEHRLLLSLAGDRRVGACSRPGDWMRPVAWRHAFWTLGRRLLQSRWGASPLLRVMGGRFPLGKRVVVVGAGFTGLEIAEYLAGKGSDVTVVDSAAQVELGPTPMYLLGRYFLSRLAVHGVAITTGVRYREITSEGLWIDESSGATRLLRADTIFMAPTLLADSTFADGLRQRGFEVHTAGDCNEAFGIREAIGAGARVARCL